MREDWIECTLGELLSVSSGKGLTSKKMDGGIFPVYGGNGITGYHSQHIFTEKKLIIGRVGVRCGVTHITQKESWVTDNALVITFKSSDFDIKFMKLKLEYENLNKLSNSTAQPVISGAKIYSHTISLAPLIEQKTIVKKIEELFNSLHSGIADLKKAQDQLSIYRQAVLKKAFEGELTKEWREKQTNLPTSDELLIQIKEERQKHYEEQLAEWKDAVKLWKSIGANDKKPAKPKFIKELINLTKEELEKLPHLNNYWHWVKADKIASHEGSSLKAGPFGSSLKKEFYTESGFKIYGQEQVISNNHRLGNYYVNQEKYDSLINCAIKPSDILISLVGTVGKVLVLPEDSEAGIINPRLVKISLNRFYESIFFKYYFESAFLKSIYSIKAHGATMDILNLGIIKELPYPLCSKEEQNQIVREIENRLSVCDKVEESIVESLKKAIALRQSILKKAFDGKLLSEEEIEKCKADKDYEPASVLLKKIKKEKLRKKK
ncbi:MAG: type I restriction enzyme S subunit [Patiriisocius sp.]|jgi:type I restriction enzyme S subunit